MTPSADWAVGASSFTVVRIVLRFRFRTHVACLVRTYWWFAGSHILYPGTISTP
jgi:hypothetical protein